MVHELRVQTEVLAETEAVRVVFVVLAEFLALHLRGFCFKKHDFDKISDERWRWKMNIVSVLSKNG